MAFSGVFNNSYVIDDINVLYTNRDKGILANSFKEFVNTVKKWESCLSPPTI